MHTEPVITDGDDRTWLQTEDRSPVLRLRADPHYWDRVRGPRVHEVVFRNDLSLDQAIDLVCDRVGEVESSPRCPRAGRSGYVARTTPAWWRWTQCEPWPV